MAISFFEFLWLTSGVIQLLFSIFLFSIPKGNLKSNRILGTFFLLRSLLIFVNFMWVHADNFLPELIHFFTIGDTFTFVVPVLFYFYTKSIVQSDFKFRKLHFFHFIPFLIFIIITINRFHLKSTSEKMNLILTGEALGREIITMLLLVSEIQIIVYLTLSLLLLRNYNLQLKNYYSTVRELNFSLLKMIFIGYILLSLVGLFQFLINRILSVQFISSNFLGSLGVVILFIFIAFIFIKILKHPEIFSLIRDREEKKKYLSSTLTIEESKYHLQKLQEFMKTEKVYLNPALSLKEVSIKLKIPTRHLSQVINENLGKNFFEFVNQYRIEEAKELLSNSETSDMSILEILLETGFNSKSTFNHTFKKTTGSTPTEYRQKKIGEKS